MFEFDIVEDIVGHNYRDLIDEIGSRASRFGIVAREVDSSGLISFMMSVGDNPIIDELRSSWPGTILLNSSARVVEYPATKHTIHCIQTASDSLFQWLQPERPEDLFAIGDTDYEFLLETVSHERFGTVRVPELSPLIARLVDHGLLAPVG
jgi:hypothetical protein